MPSLLEEILASTQAAVRRRQDAVPLAALESRLSAQGAHDGARRWLAALDGPGVRVVAEHKRLSPSGGLLSTRPLGQVLEAYERAGACALSILTEEAHFGGSLADLEQARALTSLPLLRKDFITSPYEVFESALAGADAILLIARVLAPEDLRALLALARELGLGTLVEAHSTEEAGVAVASGADVLGVNSRDLDTLEVDTAHGLALAALAPEGMRVVAESGLRGPEDLSPFLEAGVRRFLIGEALLRAPGPEEALRRLWPPMPRPDTTPQ